MKKPLFLRNRALASSAMAVWNLAAVLLLAGGSPSLQAQDDTAPVGTELFSIPDRGGQSITSSGPVESLRVGYARIRAATFSTTPSGIAIFQFRDSEGVLISEAGVPAARPVREGRIFAEVNGPVNTGLAIANPNDVSATLRFYFTDTSGGSGTGGSFELGANQQTAKFLDQAPFNGGPSVLGTFTFTSSVPVAVVALRGFTNDAGEFLMTTLPVAPLSSTASDTVYFPHLADGGGWATQVILVNPTDGTITGMVAFLGPGSDTAAASPAILTLDDDQTGSSFDYSIPPRSTQRFTTSNPAGTVAVGSVRATPDSGNAAPSGLVVFSFASGGKTVSEAGVPALPKGSAFRVYVEASGTPGQAGSIRSGLAITNAGATTNTVTLEVTHLDGSLAVPPATLALPPSGQLARFIDEIFALPDNFSGVLRVTSPADVAIVGLRLRINDRGELKMTTTPPSNETGPTTTAETFFPHIADSGGWSTQFILFSGTDGQASFGTLTFIDVAGHPLDLTITQSLAAPQDLRVSVSGTNVVTLTWVPNPEATSYVIEIGTAPGASDLVNEDTGNTDTQFVWNEPPTRRIFARVRARTTAVTSPPSNEVSVQIQPSSGTCAYTPYKPLMEQVSTVGPVCVTGSFRVPQQALDEAGQMLEIMLSNRGDVGNQLRSVGAITSVFARSENVCDLPYFADLVGSASCQAEGGLGGVPGRPATACSEKNLLKHSDDPFGRGSRAGGENVCIHELAHTIMNVGLSSGERSQIHSRFNAPDTKALWSGDFALENADEFFAEMAQAYFCANPEVPSFLHTHGINCADELRDYDRATYDMMHDIFRGAADLR